MSHGQLIGYARVSTDEQNEQPQIDALVAAGVPLDAIRVDKASGATMKRPGLDRIMKILREGDTLVVWKLDRLGRSVVGVLKTLEELEERGVQVKSITENLDTKTPIGHAMMTIILAFAQMERDMISERTKAGMAAYRARGGKTGQKHRILDFPKRLERFTELWRRGLIPDGVLTGREVVEEMNAADPDAPLIKGPQSYFNWKARGFPGFTPPEHEQSE